VQKMKRRFLTTKNFDIHCFFLKQMAAGLTVIGTSLLAVCLVKLGILRLPIRRRKANLYKNNHQLPFIHLPRAASLP
ncbi:MAG: hypothetical protein ABSF34_17510, partial [Verrucomicrobiota bacterium]